MLEWFIKKSKQDEPAIPRPLYSLEQENQLLHDMVRDIAEERNVFRVENQRLRDVNERLKRELEAERKG